MSPIALFDPSLMTAETYNKINMISSTVPFREDLISKAAEIFHRHSMTENFAPLYVHRHWDMPIASIAFQETPAEHIEITKITPVSSLPTDEIHGTSFKLEKGRFQAYEYGATSAPGFSDQFLTEFADFLMRNNLQDALGIVALTNARAPTTEFNLPGREVSIVVPTEDVPATDVEPIPTSWVIREQGTNLVDGARTTHEAYSHCLIHHAHSHCIIHHPYPTGGRGWGSGDVETMVKGILCKHGLIL